MNNSYVKEDKTMLKSVSDIRLENVEMLMKESGLDRTAFAEKFNTTYNMFSQYFSTGKSRKVIGDKKARQIEEAYGKPNFWLDNEHSESDPIKPKFNMAIDHPETLPIALREHLTAEHEESEVIRTDDIPAMLKRYVPVISWVAAGDMTPVMPATLTEVVDWIPRPKHLSDMAFGLIIRGRSMLPEFKPDEIIYVEPKFNPYYLKDGDLVVVACEGDGEATFKQLVFGETSEDMYLKPLNPEWHNQEIRPMTECHLVGRVMGKYVIY